MYSIFHFHSKSTAAKNKNTRHKKIPASCLDWQGKILSWQNTILKDKDCGKAA